MDLPHIVESGMQLFARLDSRPSLDFVYPELFQEGIKYNEVVEINNDVNTFQSVLLCEIISNTLLPLDMGGKNAGVVYLLTDGHFLISELKRILKNCVVSRHTFQPESENDDNELFIDNTVTECLEKLIVMTIFDSTQMFITIQGLEYILSKNVNISLVIIDTITAFYWSDRMFGSGILRMDSYVKKVLKMLQSATKEFRSVILYTKPGYFTSKLNPGEMGDACAEESTLERINYIVTLKRKNNECNKNATHSNLIEASVINHEKVVVKNFKLEENGIIWL